MEQMNPTAVTPSSLVFADEMPLAMRAQVLVERAESSRERREILDAQAYFAGRDEAIDRKKKEYRDATGKSYDNPSASNAKIHSNFARMLVQQKQDYALAKTFVLRVSDAEQQEISPDDSAYAREWKEFCERSLFRVVYRLAGNAINCGIGWAYVFINADGLLDVSAPDPAFVYPVWREKEHSTLDAAVYEYSVAEYRSLSPTVTRYCEYWDSENRATFDITNGYRETSDTRAQILGRDGTLAWGAPPFVPLKGNDDERTMLSFVRDYVDAYDMLSSISVDSLVDELDPLLVIKGVSPAVYDLVEARELAKMTRLMALDGDGDARYIQATANVAGHAQKLADIRRDIIRFGYGVDYEDARFGGNPNQMVIKSLYQNLDTYTDGFERHFRDFLRGLKRFFDRWYVMTGRGGEDECASYVVDALFDRSMMVNETAAVDDAAKLAGAGVSRRTVLEHIPQVEDVDVELERIAEEQKDAEDHAFSVAERNVDEGVEDAF